MNKIFTFQNIPNNKKKSISKYNLHSTTITINQTTHKPNNKHFYYTLNFPLFYIFILK